MNESDLLNSDILKQSIRLVIQSRRILNIIIEGKINKEDCEILAGEINDKLQLSLQGLNVVCKDVELSELYPTKKEQS